METVALFVFVSFCLGGVIIMSKDNIPQKLKKWLAIWAIGFIVIAFAIIIYYLLTLGT